MVRGFALRNMRKAGNNRWRKEQNEVYKLLRRTFPNDEILMEYAIPSILAGKVFAVLDIANVTKRTAYRLQGEYHNKDKDVLQAEALKAEGWLVIDLLVENGKVFDIKKQ